MHRNKICMMKKVVGDFSYLHKYNTYVMEDLTASSLFLLNFLQKTNLGCK